MSNDNSFLNSLIVDDAIIKRTVDLPKLLGKRAYYISNYKSDYFKHLKNEYNLLRDAFPGVEIVPEARIKSLSSYNNKANKILSTGSAKDIYDIFANRYIVNSVNGSSEDVDIIPILYKIRDFLSYSFPDMPVLPERIKDYVAHPKHSTYQSLHITRTNSKLGNYQFETQLRSYFMHSNAHTGLAKHSNVYKERIPGVTPIPMTLEYVFDENGFCSDVHEKPFEKAFEDFFGIPYDASRYFSAKTK